MAECAIIIQENRKTIDGCKEAATKAGTRVRCMVTVNSE